MFARFKLCFLLTAATRHCPTCDVDVPRRAFGGHLRSRQHLQNAVEGIPIDGILTVHSAFKSRVATYRIMANNHHQHVGEFMSEIKEKLVRLVTRELPKFTSVKVNVELFGLFMLESKEMEEIKSFNTRNEIVTSGTDMDALCHNFESKLSQKMSEFQERDSGMLFAVVCMCNNQVSLF